MEFTRYRYVVTVAELRSFSRAASKLYVSQPALTKSIGKLEEELGVKLFDRSSNPIRLTYAGEKYIEGMKSVLAMKRQVDREMEEIAGQKRGRLRIGIPESRSAAWLSRVLPPFMERYPGIDIQVKADTTAVLEQALSRDEVDLCIVLSLPMMVPGLGYELMSSEQLMIVVPTGHKMFGGRDPAPLENQLHYIPPEYLDGQPYISLTPSQGLYRVSSQIFDLYGIRPKAALEITNTATAFYLASEGLGFTLLTVRYAQSKKYQRQPVFCTISDPPITRQIVAAFRNDRPLSTVAREFIDMAKEVARTEKTLQSPRFEVVHDVV